MQCEQTLYYLVHLNQIVWSNRCILRNIFYSRDAKGAETIATEQPGIPLNVEYNKVASAAWHMDADWFHVQKCPE